MKKGMFPTVLGTAVTAAGYAMKKSKSNEKIANSLLGFGITHVVLGTLDLIEHRNE